MSIVSISSSSTYLPSTVTRSQSHHGHRHRHGSKLNTTTIDHTLPFLSISNTPKYSTFFHIITRTHKNKAIYAGKTNGFPPLPPLPNTHYWTLWVGGVLMSAFISIWQTKNFWEPFLTLKEKVDEVVDVVEEVAEMVETAAEGVDKVAEEIAEHLPLGSKLFVENAAERIANDVDLVGDIIDKIEATEEDLSSFIKQNREIKEEDHDPRQKNDRNNENLDEQSKEQSLN